MDFIKLFDEIAEKTEETNKKTDGDYIQNDLLHCGKCHTAKQCVISAPKRDEVTGEIVFTPRTVTCVCKCRKEELEREDDAIRIRALKAEGFDDITMERSTFKNDDLQTPEISRAMRNYVANFPELRKRGKGLLLYGNTGTGKTFFAGCIANALMEQKYSVLMTNLPKIINDMMSDYGGRNAYLWKLTTYDLIIIDDLGVERTTETARELVYSVIDAIYRSGKPFIITTNLDIEEIKKPADIKARRIYDRVLAQCHPIQINKVSRRREQIKAEFSDMQNLLFGE